MVRLRLRDLLLRPGFVARLLRFLGGAFARQRLLDPLRLRSGRTWRRQIILQGAPKSSDGMAGCPARMFRVVLMSIFFTDPRYSWHQL